VLLAITLRQGAEWLDHCNALHVTQTNRHPVDRGRCLKVRRHATAGVERQPITGNWEVQRPRSWWRELGVKPCEAKMASK